MFPYLFGWNPINLIDGESHWIIWELVFLLLAFLVSKFFHVILHYISNRIDNSLFAIFADAIYSPVIYLIWYLLALYSIDLVTDEFLSQGYPKTWMLLLNGSIVVSIGWLLVRFKNRLITLSVQSQTKQGKILEVQYIQTISKIGTMIIGLVVIILLNDFTGIKLTTLLALSGIGGLAFAFASQEIVSNFFSGFMLHINRSFLIGEYICIPSLNIEGAVEEIGWYQTRLRPVSKNVVYIPNALFSKAVLINKTRFTHRFFKEIFYVQAEPLSMLPKINHEINAYLTAHINFDHVAGQTVRIESIGPISSIVISGFTHNPSQQDYDRMRDEALLHIASIIATHGGKLVLPPNICPHT